MAIRTEIIRLRQAKNDTKRVLTNRGIVLNSDVRTEDMPPMITDMLRIERPYVTNYQYGWVNSGNYGTSATVIECDMVLLAMGFLKPEHPQYAPNVFLAGDAKSGASLVVRAIASGRETAQQVDSYLRKG